MLTKHQILLKYPEITEGMAVRSRDDHSLGKVVSVGDNFFTIQKGLFFPKDFDLRYDDILDLQDGDLRVNLTKEELKHWGESNYEGWVQVEAMDQGKVENVPSEEHRAQTLSAAPTLSHSNLQSESIQAREEVRVTAVEEVAEARRIAQQVGAVRLKKIVHSELRHFAVPVMKEEVHVERVPLSQERPLESGERAFQEETISIPIREERVEIVKKPVVREEVRITKERHEETQDVSAEIRKEEVQVDEIDIEKKKKTA